MNIWILDKDPKEVKPDPLFEPHIKKEDYALGKADVLAYVHEVDIDKLLKDFNRQCLDKCPVTFSIGDCEKCEINHMSFSQFLQEKLNQGGKE